MHLFRVIHGRGNLADNTIYGGKGGDTITGHSGDDKLFGNSGHGTITDFEVGIDTLVCSSPEDLTFTSYKGLAAVELDEPLWFSKDIVLTVWHWMIYSSRDKGRHISRT